MMCACLKRNKKGSLVLHVHVYFYPNFFEIETTGIETKKINKVESRNEKKN